MKTAPTLDEIWNGDRGMLAGIRACIDTQCIVSAVALMYAAIDSLAALTRPKEQAETSSAVFISWVETYLLPNIHLTAGDLYGARCGVLHTYKAESGKSIKGEARRLIYHWAAGPKPSTEAGEILVEVESLCGALTAAVRKFQSAQKNEKSVQDLIEFHMPNLFCYRPWPSHESQTFVLDT